MLTQTAIRNAKPATRTRRLYDGKGLYLEVTPAGSKLWRLKYRFAGKEKRLALGAWPEVGLKEAREGCDEARRLLAQGVDPSARRRAEKVAQVVAAENSFKAVADEWMATHLAGLKASYRDKVAGRLRRYALPSLGRRPVGEITAPEVLAVLRAVPRLETARRVRMHIGQVLRYAVATGRAQSDVTQSLKGALPRPQVTHMAATTDPVAVGGLLRALDAFEGTPQVTAAVGLLPLVFVRPGELRTMRWVDVDLAGATWRFTAGKTGTDHLVPLSRQALSILERLHPLTAHLPGGWVFPGGRSPRVPMSNMAINAAYRRLGIDTRNELTGHGWRAIARTLLHEQLGYPPEVIEHQLAHRVPDTLGRAYNRTRFLEQRREMMQAWADYLDRLRQGAKVVSIREAKAPLGAPTGR